MTDQKTEPEEPALLEEEKANEIIAQSSYKDLSARLESVLKLLKEVESEVDSKSNGLQSIRQEIENMKLQTSALKCDYGRLKWDQVRREGYPQPKRDETAIDIFQNSNGEKISVVDNYRWLEDPDCKESRDWIYEQVKICNSYLDIVCGNVAQIYAELEKNLNFARYSTPNKKGDIYYYSYNSGLQNQSVLYYHCNSLNDEQHLLIDPNLLSADGTTALKGYYFSDDGKYICYGISEKGSDWREFRVKEVKTGIELKNDVLKWCKFTSITWLKDNSGFFYNRYNTPVNDSSNDSSKSKGTETDKLNNQQLFFHRLGTNQSEDIFLVDAKTLGNEEWMIGTGITYDGNYLELYISPSCDPVNRLYLIDLRGQKVLNDALVFQSQMIRLVDDFTFGYDVIYNVGTYFYFKTNDHASNYRIIAYDIKQYKQQSTVEWIEIIPETKFRLDCVKCVGKGGKYLLLDYNQDVKTVLSLVTLKGREVKNNIVFPAAGTIYWNGSPLSDQAFFKFSSFLYPGTIFTYNFDDHVMCEWKAIQVPGFNASEYQTQQVFYSSKDGTKIPMYILSSKDLEMNGENPTILYGYGGFDISLMPTFSISRVLWLKHTGGVYCVANLRGGGEYGEKWHKAGCKALKQNVFDDFHSAAEFLFNAKYTNNKKLAIEGGSNGGLLVACCLNQRPDLYQCGVAHCGVLDMLKFHKFTIGYAWISDYGSADVPEEFDAIFRYSPLNNIPVDNVNGYPSLMTTTADHDDRVSPLHTFKFMAQLQYQNPQNANPILTRIDVRSGHGSSSLTKGIESRADTFAFIARALHAQWK